MYICILLKVFAVRYQVLDFMSTSKQPKIDNWSSWHIQQDCSVKRWSHVTISDRYCTYQERHCSPLAHPTRWRRCTCMYPVYSRQCKGQTNSYSWYQKSKGYPQLITMRFAKFESQWQNNKYYDRSLNWNT